MQTVCFKEENKAFLNLLYHSDVMANVHRITLLKNDSLEKKLASYSEISDLSFNKIKLQ